jgi:hypothetical protein
VDAQGKVLKEATWKAAVETALEKASRGVEVRPDGAVFIDPVARADLDLLAGQRVESLGVAPDSPVATQVRQDLLTWYHLGIAGKLQESEPASALAYISRHEPEIDPEEARKARKALTPAATATAALQAVLRIERTEADPAKRTELVLALPPEIADKALTFHRERRAMAAAGHQEAQRALRGTVDNAISGGKIRGVAELEVMAEFGKLDEGQQADARDYLLAKQRQAAAERRAREDHGAAREQSRRDLEFTTWFARQPAAARLTTNVDEVAARRGASVTAANRAGMLQQSTRASLPRMFDQQGFARQAEQAALVQWPGSGAQQKAIRAGFVSELRAWHDGEIEGGRPVDAKAFQARTAYLLTAGEETTDGWVNDNMTRFEAQRQGLGFREFPADEQTNPVVKSGGARGELLPNDPTKPIIENPDGSYSTESTMTFESDGKYYVAPTIVGGKRYTPDEAIRLWREGKNAPVGEFATQREADAYAQKRHEREAATREKDRVPPVPGAVKTKSGRWAIKNPKGDWEYLP